MVKGNGKSINYLTPPRIFLALVTAWLRQGRWFDDQVVSGSQLFILEILVILRFSIRGSGEFTLFGNLFAWRL